MTVMTKVVFFFAPGFGKDEGEEQKVQTKEEGLHCHILALWTIRVLTLTWGESGGVEFHILLNGAFYSECLYCRRVLCPWGWKGRGRCRRQPRHKGKPTIGICGCRRHKI